MIISHEHRYVFVELYQTGSTAISAELRENYGGQPILKKHSFYEEFLRVASPDERTYFAFSGIRNPLEVVTSAYQKYKADQDDYENPKYWSENGGWMTPRIRRHFAFARRDDVGFVNFLNKFYWFPYDNWSRLSHHRMDALIRFENLQDDFFECLRKIGVEPVRPLPAKNVTVGKRADPIALYTPEVRRAVIRNFGPFMQKWGYSFPEDWGDVRVPLHRRWLFELCAIPRRARWEALMWMNARQRRRGGMPGGAGASTQAR